MRRRISTVSAELLLYNIVALLGFTFVSRNGSKPPVIRSAISSYFLEFHEKHWENIILGFAQLSSEIMLLLKIITDNWKLCFEKHLQWTNCQLITKCSRDFIYKCQSKFVAILWLCLLKLLSKLAALVPRTYCRIGFWSFKIVKISCS